MNVKAPEFEQVFKKSEHEELMGEMKKLREAVEEVLGKPIYIPIEPCVPYVPPCCPNCHRECYGCPYGKYEPYPDRFYPPPSYPVYPYYDCWKETGVIGTIPMDVGCAS